MKSVRLLALIVAVIAMGLLTACTTSQRINFLDMPADAADVELPDVAAYQEKYGDHDGVYLLYETTHEHSGSLEQKFMGGTDWKYSRVVRERYFVFDATNEGLTSFRVYGRPDQLYIHLLAPDGSRRSYGVDDLKSEKDEDGDDRWVLVFPDVVAGTLIDLGWEREWQLTYSYPPLDHDVPLQFRYPCESISFTYSYPEWWGLDIKRPRDGEDLDLEHLTDLESKKTTIRYVDTDVPAVESEPYAPFFKELVAYLQFQVNDLQMGAGRLDRPDTWQEVADQFQRNVLKKSGKHEGHLADQARELVGEADTDVACAEAIVTYVQNEIKLSGGSVDGDYKKVLREKTGNVFEVTGLAQTLLRSLDIEAFMVFVHSAEDGWFDPEYVCIDQFKYPAVHAVLDGEDYVLFPYVKHLPVQHTPRWLQGQAALQFVSADDRDTGSGAGQALLWQVPEGSRLETTIRSSFDLTIEPDGLINVEETRTLAGDAAFLMRTSLQDLDDDEERKLVEKLLTYTDGEVDLQEYRIENRDALTEVLQVVMTYTIDNLVMMTPEEIIMQTGGLLSPLSTLNVKVDPDERQNPIRITYDEHHTKDITIHYPEGWSITTDLVDADFENDFGAIRSHYEQADETLHVDQALELNRSQAPAERFPELLELLGERQQLYVPAIVFSVGGV